MDEGGETWKGRCLPSLPLFSPGFWFCFFLKPPYRALTLTWTAYRGVFPWPRSQISAKLQLSKQ